MTIDVNLPPKSKSYRASLIIGVVAVGIAAGFAVDHVMMHAKYESPAMKVQLAIQEFRAGYDQSALSLLTPLANDGNAKAQYWLADIDENGLGVKTDVPAAIALLEKSAAQGFVPAERRLGELYLEGNEAIQDFAKAYTWLHAAAIAGDSSAQRQLGHLYALGLGIQRDPVQAYGWFENAALNGDGLAMHLRDALVTQMSASDVTAGEAATKTIAGSIKFKP